MWLNVFTFLSTFFLEFQVLCLLLCIPLFCLSQPTFVKDSTIILGSNTIISKASQLLLNKKVNPSLPADFVRIKKKKLLIENKSFLISGTFTIDQDLSLNACDIQLASDAVINVINGARLEMDECHLHSCSDYTMWQGIEIDGIGNYASIKHCIVEDAKLAVHSNNGGYYRIEGNLFNKNGVSVAITNYAGSFTPNVPFAPNYSFGNNIYTCRKLSIGSTIPADPLFTGWDRFNDYDAALYPNNYSLKPLAILNGNYYYGARSFVGVLVGNITNAQNFIVGANTFDNLDVGIYSRSSNVEALGNIFINLKPYILNGAMIGTGIFANSSNNLCHLKVGGTGQGANYFNDCAVGVSTNSTNLNVDGNYFSNILRRGVNVNNASHTNVEINRNIFDYIATGIYCYGMNQSQWGGFAHIEKNRFNEHQALPLNGNTANNLYAMGYGSIGILAKQDAPTPTAANLTITTNQIIDMTSGIEVWNLKIVKAKENTITYTSGAINNTECGIKLRNCARATVEQNTISSAIIPTTETAPLGINIDATAASWIKENIITNMGTGIYAENQCPNTFFQCNHLDNDFHGIRFGNGNTLPATISHQIDLNNNTQGTGNDWNITTPTWITGDVVGPDPMFPLVKRWYYTASFGNNPNSFSSPNIFFFNPSANGSQCLGGVRSPVLERADAAGIAVATTNQAIDTIAEAKVLAAMAAYRYLVQRDTILNLGTADDTVYQQFYDKMRLAEMGKLVAVELTLSDTAATAISIAEAINNGISPRFDIEAAQKMVNEIYFRKLVYEKDSMITLNSTYPYTEAEEQTLDYIAHYYPGVGGNAVYQARVMLGIDVMQGAITERRMNLVNQSHIPLANPFKLYPNPSTGLVSMEYALKANEKGYLKLYDSQSRLLHTELLRNDAYKSTFDIGYLQAGIYFYAIEINGTKMQNGKLVIIK